MRTVRVRAVTVRIGTVRRAHQFRGRLHGIDTAADNRRRLDCLDRRRWLCLLLVMVYIIIMMMMLVVVAVVVLWLLMVIMMMILDVLVHVVGLRLTQGLHVVVNHWDTG